MKKKFVAVLLSAVMVLSLATPAFARVVDDYGSLTPGPIDTAVGQDATISGDGSIIIVNTLLIDVTLPTAGNFDFIMDPMGLHPFADLDLNDDDVVADLEARGFEFNDDGDLIITDAMRAPYIGRIHALDTHAIFIGNHSTVPVQVGIELYLEVGDFAGTTANDYDDAVAGIRIAEESGDAADAVDYGTGTAIMLYVVGAYENVLGFYFDEDEDAYDFTAIVRPLIEDVVWGGTGVIIASDDDDDADEMNFVFPAVEFDIVRRAGATGAAAFEVDVQHETFQGTALRIGGYVNRNAISAWLDWAEAYDADNVDISINALFTLDIVDVTVPGASDFVSDVAHLLDEAGLNTHQLPPPPYVPTLLGFFDGLSVANGGLGGGLTTWTVNLYDVTGSIVIPFYFADTTFADLNLISAGGAGTPQVGATRVAGGVQLNAALVSTLQGLADGTVGGISRYIRVIPMQAFEVVFIYES